MILSGKSFKESRYFKGRSGSKMTTVVYNHFVEAERCEPGAHPRLLIRQSRSNNSSRKLCRVTASNVAQNAATSCTTARKPPMHEKLPANSLYYCST